MRISDWSSDVCSSDLPPGLDAGGVHVDEVHAARVEARRVLGRALFEGWSALYDRLSAAEAGGATDLSTAAIGRRALGNADQTSVVSGKRVFVRVDFVGRGLIQKKKTRNKTEQV